VIIRIDRELSAEFYYGYKTDTVKPGEENIISDHPRGPDMMACFLEFLPDSHVRLIRIGDYFREFGVEASPYRWTVQIAVGEEHQQRRKIGLYFEILGVRKRRPGRSGMF
jgi:hypothetical protein